MIVFEHIREHLLLVLGYSPKIRKMPDLSELYKTEWNKEFEQLRKNRMVMGAFRYGTLAGKEKRSYDLWAGLQRKLDIYKETGNLEAIVDAANYLMLIFTDPVHPKAHFKAEDNHAHCPVISETKLP